MYLTDLSGTKVHTSTKVQGTSTSTAFSNVWSYSGHFYRKKSKKSSYDEKTREGGGHSMDKREKSVYLSEIEFSGLKPAKTSKTRFKKCFY